jgi:hypothetical protein
MIWRCAPVVTVLLAACMVKTQSPAPSSIPALNVVAHIERIDTLTREPMIVQHQSGALFMAGYNRNRPGLWKSSDTGRTWDRVNVGSSSDGATGNSDVDLALAPDGTLYFVNMTFDRTAGEGRRITVGVSRDIGASWKWSTISETRFDDRPWVEVEPNGVAHIVWNDDRGVNHSVSRDGGATWTRTARINDSGGSSHMSIGPRGEIAVRIGPGAASGNKCDSATDIVAISTDGGESWIKHPAAGAPRQSGCLDDQKTPRWVDPLAWTSDGRLYALWTDSSGVKLSATRDNGATWTTTTLVRTTGPDALPYFPYLTGNPKGELAATWFTGVDDAMRWHAAFIDVHDPAHPLMRLSSPMTMESWRGNPLAADAGGEYLAAAFLSDGTFAVVTPVQNEAGGRLGFSFWRFRP